MEKMRRQKCGVRAAFNAKGRQMIVVMCAVSNRLGVVVRSSKREVVGSWMSCQGEDIDFS